VLLLLFAAGLVAVRLMISRAEPILRARVIETLSARFKSKVELTTFHVSVANGLRVSGGGLKIFGATDPNRQEPGIQPLIGVGEFHFETGIPNLFRSPMHIDAVYVKGLELNIPPKETRKEMTSMGSHSKLKIFVDKFVCEDTKLVVNTLKPGKMPLEFDIGDLKMKDIGPGQPMHFDATLVNPKPVGDIKSSGLFGPFREDSPRESPVQGDYSFDNADLGTIKGIGGILSSTGKYEGTLGNIVVDGKTDTPDFRLASSGHAVVDGTSGDTYLQPVDATLLHSSFTARGSVVRVKDPNGHDIELDVDIQHARIEDLLTLGVRALPPIMTGPVTMKTSLSLPPGDPDVVNRLKLNGKFHVPNAHFSNDQLQGKLDSLSLRSQGKPKLAQEHVEQNVPTDLQGSFILNHGRLSLPFLHFLIPGTHIDMKGDYTLDGENLNFTGTARLDATVSHMVTGWKSVLLKPVDPFFRKNGVGTEVPIKVTGTRSEPHFSLDFHHKDQGRNVNKSDPAENSD